MLTTHRLHALQRAYAAALAPRLAELGLHAGQELLLGEVAGNEDISHAELARHLAVQPPSVTKVVSGLERAGLVARTGDPEDGRVSRVRLTSAGRQLMPAVRRAWAEVEQELLGSLSPTERASLDHLLDRILPPR